MASLALGIASLVGTCFTGVPAVVCGHIALAQIRNEGHVQPGSNMARAGLLFGYFGIAVAFLFVVAWLIDKFRESAPQFVYTP